MKMAWRLKSCLLPIDGSAKYDGMFRNLNTNTTFIAFRALFLVAGGPADRI
jgi:hypothetical protein